MVYENQIGVLIDQETLEKRIEEIGRQIQKSMQVKN